ncbi:hypothetical protein TELCIR_13775 [Teladorsagia circumcincta]|uniref:Amino acid transporter transmembrane domain-containing protein n=1 Tax=Teladorsagia circumcincta TaxID=45464 RepID=A0A2G9U2Y2_TELCI|nr:hypothetical protein TELCIR_13775 [Teladorsagia circumcincta]
MMLQQLLSVMRESSGSTRYPRRGGPRGILLDRKKLTTSIDREVALDYGDMTKEAFMAQKPALRLLALPAKFAVNFCLFLYQLGICSVYFIFVSEHFKETVDFIFDTDLSLKLIFVIMVPFFMLLTTVQNVFLMSCISLSGNVLITTAVAIVLVKLAIMPHIPLSELAGVTTISSAAMAAGTITFSYASQVVPRFLGQSDAITDDILRLLDPTISHISNGLAGNATTSLAADGSLYPTPLGYARVPLPQVPQVPQYGTVPYAPARRNPLLGAQFMKPINVPITQTAHFWSMNRT